MSDLSGIWNRSCDFFLLQIKFETQFERYILIKYISLKYSEYLNPVKFWIEVGEFYLEI